jgi:hypothetical protein
MMFCQCPLPGRPRAHDRCHRVDVASLLLKAAAKRNISLTIAEWPGGQLQSRALKIDDLQLEKVRSGARNLVLGQRQPSVDLLALPWGSLVRLKSPSFSARAIADPAVYRGGKWLLPIPLGIDDQLDASALRKKSLAERRVSGLDSRRS